MKLYLVDTSLDIVTAWETAFSKFEGVTIECGDILNLAHDTLVSPANSYGYMDGGIDRIYRDHFDIQIEHTVQKEIGKREEGYLPVGESIVVPTHDKVIPRLIVAPTMFLPEPIKPDKCFFAMTSILNTASKHADIEHVFCPGLGTGVGQVEPMDSANEMARAYTKWLKRNKAQI